MEMQPLVYSKKHNVIGFMTKMDFKSRTVAFEVDDVAQYEVTFEDAVIMRSFGDDPSGVPLFDGDIFESHVSDSLYEAELMGDGTIQFHLVDKNLKRVHEVDRYPVGKFLNMLHEANTYEVLGSKYELEPEEEESMDFDFNVKIVKKKVEDGNIYYYACNNKDVEQVDFIKVVFVGSALLKEEQYNRVTVSYEDFKLYMENSGFTEVSPSELQSYAMNQMWDTRKTPASAAPCDDCDCTSDEYCDIEPPADFDENSEDDACDCDNCISGMDEGVPEPFCNECDKPADKCECELWKRKSK